MTFRDSSSLLSPFYSLASQKNPLQNLNLIFIQLWIHLHINKLLMTNPVKVDGQGYHPPHAALAFCPLALKLAEIPCRDISVGGQMQMTLRGL